MGVKVKYGKSSNKIKESESEINKVLKLFSKEVKVKYRKSLWPQVVGVHFPKQVRRGTRLGHNLNEKAYTLYKHDPNCKIK